MRRWVSTWVGPLRRGRESRDSLHALAELLEDHAHVEAQIRVVGAKGDCLLVLHDGRPSEVRPARRRAREPRGIDLPRRFGDRVLESVDGFARPAHLEERDTEGENRIRASPGRAQADGPLERCRTLASLPRRSSATPRR